VLLRLGLVLAVVLVLGGAVLLHRHSSGPSRPSGTDLAQMEDMKAALRSSPRFALCSAKGRKLHWSESRVVACVRDAK